MSGMADDHETKSETFIERCTTPGCDCGGNRFTVVVGDGSSVEGGEEVLNLALLMAFGRYFPPATVDDDILRRAMQVLMEWEPVYRA